MPLPDLFYCGCREVQLLPPRYRRTSFELLQVLTFVMRDSTCIEQNAISLLKQDSINDKKRENKKVLLRSEWDLNPLRVGSIFSHNCMNSALRVFCNLFDTMSQ